MNQKNEWPDKGRDQFGYFATLMAVWLAIGAMGIACICLTWWAIETLTLWIGP
jgi:hypothetical protein